MNKEETKDKTVQKNIQIKESVLYSEKMKEKTEDITFSQYVVKLIKEDFKKE